MERKTIEECLQSAVGKTIKDAFESSVSGVDGIEIRFTDGTGIYIETSEWVSDVTDLDFDEGI